MNGLNKEKPLNEKRFGLGKDIPEAIMNDMFFYYEEDVAKAVKKSKARRKNQLRIHWFWLKDKSWEEVVLFLNAIDNKIMGEFK